MAGLWHSLLHYLRVLRADTRPSQAHERRSGADATVCLRCGVCHHVCGLMRTKTPRHGASGLED